MEKEKRLIDADALLEKIQFRLPVVGTIAEVVSDIVGITRRHIEETPTVDAVEVVRCKDCFADGCCSVQIDLDMGGDGYCSKGKRRTDNG